MRSSGNTVLLHRCLLVPLLLVYTGSGCARVPQQSLDDSALAMAGAELAARCAPEEYAAAQRMMDRARELVAKEEYEEAETAAITAKELFEKARLRAEERREQCLRPPPAPDQGLKTPELAGAPLLEGDYQLTPILFDYDAATIGESERPALERHARYLAQHAELRIQVAGHCDDQGSTEYNLALGERRAEAVRRYLVSLGVAAERLSTISYGEELPAVPGASAVARRKNRRAEFRVR